MGVDVLHLLRTEADVVYSDQMRILKTAAEAALGADTEMARQFRTLFEWQAASHGRPPELAEAERATAQSKEPKMPEAAPFVNELELRRHSITHHRYTLSVRRATVERRAGKGFRWFRAHELARIPFSTTARKALKLAGIVATVNR